MIKHICDICGQKQPDVRVKWKYRAERFSIQCFWDGYGLDNIQGWERLELCNECLDKIIKAKKENEDDTDRHGNAKQLLEL